MKDNGFDTPDPVPWEGDDAFGVEPSKEADKDAEKFATWATHLLGGIVVLGVAALLLALFVQLIVWVIGL